MFGGNTDMDPCDTDWYQATVSLLIRSSNPGSPISQQFGDDRDFCCSRWLAFFMHSDNEFEESMLDLCHSCAARQSAKRFSRGYTNCWTKRQDLNVSDLVAEQKVLIGISWGYGWPTLTNHVVVLDPWIGSGVFVFGGSPTYTLW